ncbi:hypothetical protein [Cardinium endosymbiont of Tipula unca]|uniref:hypothetical protein n=1 Tax=Cardinium endosymbiont of Tipula unca TaxID=3066216 RepID=UPI0030D1CA2E
MLIFSIRLLVKIVVLATCTKACFLSQKVYYKNSRKIDIYSIFYEKKRNIVRQC